MASGTRSFVLNRPTDWKEKSLLENLSFEGDSVVSNNEDGLNGVYISTSFDSLQGENVWHRLRLFANIPQNVLIRLKIYTSDDLYAMVPGITSYGDKPILLDEYILDKSINTDEKIKAFDFLGAKEYENPGDLVLFEFKGRYMWVCIEVVSYSGEVAVIDELKIDISRVSFINYLPQIYRGGTKKDSFLARFLFIFQSLYVDLEDNIDNTPVMYDPDLVDPEFLNWLIEWVSIKDQYIWGEEKLRLILKNALELYKMKGTKDSIKRIVELYMGEIPIIVEQFEVSENEHYESERQHIENLFGDNGYVFTVIVKTDKSVSSETYAELMKLINRFKPIDTICNLVILSNEIYLDYHCYIGINSYTTSNDNIVLDEENQSPTQLFLIDPVKE